MSLNTTPRGNRLYIALFGKRNAGKSSLINAITNQDTAIVSEQKGTTTDPVYKVMELLPLGPIVLIDTPGLDDEGTLGNQRVKKALEILDRTNVALFITNSYPNFDDLESETLQALKNKNIPCILVFNKIDLFKEDDLNIYMDNLHKKYLLPVVPVSALKKQGVEELKLELSKIKLDNEDTFPIVSDLISPFDTIILVTPIDEAAPKGRLILPQQQTIREILDSDGIAVVTKETTYPEVFSKINVKPKMVITDSAAFDTVYKNTPKDVFLTSFSILFARHKGDLDSLVKGTLVINNLKDHDKILIAEGCTHHRQCNDIGTVKIPNMLRKKTGKELVFETVSGNSFPDNLSDYALIIHCGACTLNRKEMLYRIQYANEFNLPIVNYGVLIAYLQGILEHSIEVFQSKKI